MVVEVQLGCFSEEPGILASCFLGFLVIWFPAFLCIRMLMPVMMQVLMLLKMTMLVFMTLLPPPLLLLLLS